MLPCTNTRGNDNGAQFAGAVHSKRCRARCAIGSEDELLDTLRINCSSVGASRCLYQSRIRAEQAGVDVIRADNRIRLLSMRFMIQPAQVNLLRYTTVRLSDS